MAVSKPSKLNLTGNDKVRSLTGSVDSEFVLPLGGVTNDLNGYRYHTFTSTGTLTVNSGLAIDYLLIGGGGGGSGGLAENYYGAGGAAGVFRQSAASLSPNTVYTITVGSGGAGAALNGGAAQNGTASSIDSIVTATGGNGATSANRVGGSNADYSGHDTVAGIYSGGGAGAGNSASSSSGGPAVTSSFTGTSVAYGLGGSSTSAAGTATPANTGNGGDGTGGANVGRTGSDGIVIIRYAYTPPSGIAYIEPLLLIGGY
jgi:hypothetical protein